MSDAALIAANLFAGGQETTVRLLSFALRMLGERPDLQELVRDDRDRIPNFIEETLRLESPLRTQFRMARVRTNLAGVDIPAGGTIMLAPGACNRDPRVFERPHEFDIDRANARQHIGFGHGIHTCAGAPLARAEGRVTLNRFLDRTTDITISEKRARPGRRPPVRVPADLLPPRPPEPPPRLHAPMSDRTGAMAPVPPVAVAPSGHDELRLRVAAGRRSCRRRSATRCR